MSSDALKLAKAALRKSIAEQILQMTPLERASQSEQVVRRILASRAFASARRVSVYLSTSEELCTDRIVEAGLTAGKAIFVPQYGKHLKHGMEMLRLHSLEDFRSLPLTRWNIRQPAVQTYEARENALSSLEDEPEPEARLSTAAFISSSPDVARGLDLILVPGVAFTRCGLRLGHGMGYYDAYLKRWKAAQERLAQLNAPSVSTGSDASASLRPLAIGLCFTQQLRDASEVPVGAHDVPLDAVLYPDAPSIALFD